MHPSAQKYLSVFVVEWKFGAHSVISDLYNCKSQTYQVLRKAINISEDMIWIVMQYNDYCEFECIYE